MVCRFKSQFTSEYLLAFQCGSSPRSHFYLFPMLRRVACVQTSPMIEWQKPNRYVTIHFENKRGEASLRNRNCGEITIGYSSPISYCFLVGTWAFRYFVIIASEFRPMPWVSRISDDRQTLAFSRALISFSPLLQTPLNFIQANSLTLRKSSFFSKVSEGLEPETTGLPVCDALEPNVQTGNSLRASSPVWASRSEPRENARARGGGKRKASPLARAFSRDSLRSPK